MLSDVDEVISEEFKMIKCLDLKLGFVSVVS
jgi:hypothetical protein